MSDSPTSAWVEGMRMWTRDWAVAVHFIPRDQRQERHDMESEPCICEIVRSGHPSP